MKKAGFIIGFFMIVFSFIGCDLFIASKVKPSTPINVQLFDETLTWDSSSLADKYYIYADGEFIDETNETSFYFTSTITVDQNITVSAVSSEEGELLESSQSGVIIRYKNSFSLSETMIFDFRNGFGEPYNNFLVINQNFEIDSNIRYVQIIGNTGDTYSDLSFHIANRNLPLQIDIENVKIEAKYDCSVIYSDAPLSGNYLVTINSLGSSNELYGGLISTTGSRGDDAEVLFAIGGDGGVGNQGVAAISLPRVLIKGSSDILLEGGIGGIGGAGGNGKSNYGGDGGDGGTGGSGAEFIKLYVKLDDTTIITFIGGPGGEGGYPGNSTLLTSPSEGDFGEQGEDYVGSLTLISGIIG